MTLGAQGQKRRPALPIALWTALLCGGSALATAGGTAVVLTDVGRLDRETSWALATGAAVGLVVALLALLGALHLAAELRLLHTDAVRRLREPSVPLSSRVPQKGTLRASSELAELACVLDALHLRVRVADELGERHRREAQNAGAGVFELLSGLVAAEEGARGQLAAELHDTVAQSLMIALGLLRDRPGTPAEIATIHDHVQDAEEQVRAVMARTRPPALREGDLATAVAALAQDLLVRYGLAVQISWPSTAVPLPLALAVTLYRFFQEALLNVVKHADVDTAELTLTVTFDSVLAEVRDEGPGFEPGAVRPRGGRHVGLGLLSERARLAGGSLEVSAGGGGTTLRLALPRGALPRVDVPDVDVPDVDVPDVDVLDMPRQRVSPAWPAQ